MMDLGHDVSAFAETGLGIHRTRSAAEGHHIGHGAVPEPIFSALQLWPTGDGAEASSIYNTDIAAGNGGYFERRHSRPQLSVEPAQACSLRTLLARTSAPRRMWFLVSLLWHDDSNNAVPPMALSLLHTTV